MAFTPRTIAEIRDSLLGYWSAEYAANGETLLVVPGSDAYLLAGMIAVIQNACDVQAQQVARDILPDQASDSAIARHGYVNGVVRGAATAAALTVEVTGTPSATITIPAGAALSWTDGTLYASNNTSVTLNGGGVSTISVTSTTTGISTTRAVGDVLTWQSAPAGLDPTGEVTVVGTDGEDAESYQEWAQRIISRLRERPASGNRSDIKAWCEAYVGTSIASVYVYALLQPPTVSPGVGTEDVLGCWTAVVVGPAQGDSTTNTRIVPADDASTRTAGAFLQRIMDYIEGTRTTDGTVTPVGVQLRPVTMGSVTSGDWDVEAINTQSQDVAATVVTTAACVADFSVAPTVAAGGTTTSVIVAGDYGAGGIQDLSGLYALVNVGTGNYRGGFYRVLLGTGVYNGGTALTTFPIATAMPGAPVAASTMYGALACWSALRTAVFAYFDALGPSDTTTPCRWPTEDYGGRATLYRTALQGIMTAVPGVLSCTITTPAGNVTPTNAKTVLTLGTFLVTA